MVRLKRPDEIERMRTAGHLVGRTLAEVARLIGPGVTTSSLDDVAEAFIRDHGGRPAFKGYDPGWGGGGFPGSLCISVNEEVVHGIPGDYVLQEGDVLSVDCGIELDGYYGDSAYTFAVGEITPDKRRLLKTTYDALLAGVSQSVHGKRIGDIGFAVQEVCEREGFGVVRELVGHGIGQQLHEEPQVPNYGRRGSGKKLKAGMTFCIEPMVNAGTDDVMTGADGWAILAADGQTSAHYEHMVLVQKGRPELLTTFEYIEAVVTPPYLELQHEEALNGEAASD